MSNLKFLKKILDSAPDSIYKIEDLTCNLDLEMPQSLGRLDDLNILCIISNINEKTTIEGKTLLKIYAHLPKNIKFNSGIILISFQIIFSNNNHLILREKSHSPTHWLL